MSAKHFYERVPQIIFLNDETYVTEFRQALEENAQRLQTMLNETAPTTNPRPDCFDDSTTDAASDPTSDSEDTACDESTCSETTHNTDDDPDVHWTECQSQSVVEIITHLLLWMDPDTRLVSLSRKESRDIVTSYFDGHPLGVFCLRRLKSHTLADILKTVMRNSVVASFGCIGDSSTYGQKENEPVGHYVARFETIITGLRAFYGMNCDDEALISLLLEGVNRPAVRDDLWSQYLSSDDFTIDHAVTELELHELLPKKGAILKKGGKTRRCRCGR
ncbi:MAG: hypothetical protein KVP17_003999 [Porospora cf. gigantea B]|uniref:uncharacterized protein n=1 Tax=Porospora cf. gigantea B TaxID=2853592 RepID=UPI003571E325|nr:MAG: hypothetical protein KVP17_003999 [Porospora cf. gigantea B]